MAYGSSESIEKDAAQKSVLTRRRALLKVRRLIYVLTDGADYGHLVLELLPSLSSQFPVKTSFFF